MRTRRRPPRPPSLAALAALAWGIARRRGRLWMLGLALVAGLSYLGVHHPPAGLSPSDRDVWPIVHAGWVIAPAVVGGLLSWWLEHLEVR